MAGGTNDMTVQNYLVAFFQDKAMEKENGKWKRLEGGCRNYWLPYSDTQEEGVWRNSYTNQQLDTFNWAPKEPTETKTENCLGVVVRAFDDDQGWGMGDWGGGT